MSYLLGLVIADSRINGQHDRQRMRKIGCYFEERLSLMQRFSDQLPPDVVHLVAERQYAVGQLTAHNLAP